MVVTLAPERVRSPFVATLPAPLRSMSLATFGSALPAFMATEANLSKTMSPRDESSRRRGATTISVALRARAVVPATGSAACVAPEFVRVSLVAAVKLTLAAPSEPVNLPTSRVSDPADSRFTSLRNCISPRLFRVSSS